METDRWRRLEALFGPEYAVLVESAGRARRRGRARAATAAARAAAGERAARRAFAAQDARASWQGLRLAR